MEITARSANEALANGVRYLLLAGEAETSRNGDVLACPEPVLVRYLDPCNRVLRSPTRDANPFFHLAEALWMLSGRNDLAFLQQFVSTFDAYSDDGVTLHGAYGHRWRKHFGVDQLHDIAGELQKNPNSRRAVLGMWNPSADLPMLLSGGRDVPCNTQAYFDIRGGRMNMTVTNRSNDALFGCFGANLVHFSVLLEFMAAWLGVPVGEYRQFTNNLHVYTNVFSREKLERICTESETATSFAGVPLVSIPVYEWQQELELVMSSEIVMLDDPFLRDTVNPMLEAWRTRKRGAPVDEVMAMLEQVQSTDWRVAATEWVERRKK